MTAAPKTSLVDILFCHRCQSILDLPSNEDIVVCNVCGATRDAKEFENIEIVTSSKKDPFQNIQEILAEASASKKNSSATIKERCPKCAHPELEFYTMQLRSADEGQTVFYTCPNCSYKYSVNN